MNNPVLQAGVKSAMVGTAFRMLSLAHYTPVSRWMAVSLMTVERLEGERFQVGDNI